MTIFQAAALVSSKIHTMIQAECIELIYFSLLDHRVIFGASDLDGYANAVVTAGKFGVV